MLVLRRLANALRLDGVREPKKGTFLFYCLIGWAGESAYQGRRRRARSIAAPHRATGLRESVRT